MFFLAKPTGETPVPQSVQPRLPGTLKAVLDLLLREYVHRAVAFVGVSQGPWGGTRVIEAMVPMVPELGLAVTFSDLNFPKVLKTFDAKTIGSGG